MTTPETHWTEDYRLRYSSSEKVKSHLEYFTELARQPKSPTTRQKMSASHKNRTKSSEHKQHLSEAQRARHAIRREVLKNNPGLTLSEQWARVREIQDGNKVQDDQQP